MRNLIPPLLLILLTAVLGFLPQYSRAQVFFNANLNQAPALVAAAGADATICPGDTTTLGGNPAASGGTGTLSYNWFPTTGLSSATAANPNSNPAATTQYLLTVTDQENCTSRDTIAVIVDTCVSIDPNRLPLRVTMFPNPTEGRFDLLLQGDQADGTYQVLITNQAGQIVVKDELKVMGGQAQKQLDLSNHAAGVYLIHLSHGTQNAVFRMVKK
ncbi:MAG: T9SS type A sorting domain-containing protein [Bacteroidia bacterium]|nr:T9SS type A sorting domain-containing protein [Bacteroidia bacterium]